MSITRADWILLNVTPVTEISFVCAVIFNTSSEYKKHKMLVTLYNYGAEVNNSKKFLENL